MISIQIEIGTRDRCAKFGATKERRRQDSIPACTRIFRTRVPDIPEHLKKRDTRLTNESGMNFGNRFAPPLVSKLRSELGGSNSLNSGPQPVASRAAEMRCLSVPSPALVSVEEFRQFLG